MTHVCSLSWQALITHRVASRPLSCVLTGKRPVRISLRPCLQQAAGQRRRGPYLQCAGRHLHRCSSNIGRRGSAPAPENRKNSCRTKSKERRGGKGGGGTDRR